MINEKGKNGHLEQHQLSPSLLRKESTRMHIPFIDVGGPIPVTARRASLPGEVSNLLE
jgi:hypothetical protein